MSTPAELRAAATEARRQAQALCDAESAPDRAGAMVGARAHRASYKHTDSRLRRYVELDERAKALEFKANLAELRADEAARVRLTYDDVKGATLIRTSVGWHEVVRVNKKSVTVKTEYSWDNRYSLDKVLEVRPRREPVGGAA